MTSPPWVPGQRVWWYERQPTKTDEHRLVRMFGVIRVVHEKTASVRVHVPIERASFIEPESSRVVRKSLDRLNRIGRNLNGDGNEQER